MRYKYEEEKSFGTKKLAPELWFMYLSGYMHQRINLLELGSTYPPGYISEQGHKIRNFEFFCNIHVITGLKDRKKEKNNFFIVAISFVPLRVN